ncbi:MAG: hypothetical protein ABSC19_00470 [Syntrophorhabdales bacterium]|jgi:acylphosphatase
MSVKVTSPDLRCGNATEEEGAKKTGKEGGRGRSARSQDINVKIDALEKAVSGFVRMFCDLQVRVELSGTRKLTMQLSDVFQKRKVKGDQHEPATGRAYMVEEKEI